jgi:predicted PurR-regulated permease PerM
MPAELSERQRRLLDTVLVFGVVALGFVVVADVAGLLAYFADILLLFFLAWLIAFAILPLINLVKRVVPALPDALAVILVYLAVVGVLLALVIQVSAGLAASIGQFVNDLPQHNADLIRWLTDLQARLSTLGFQVDLVGQVPVIVSNLQTWATQLIGPLQQIAVASVGVLGNILIVVILSVYLAVDREAALAFVYRLVPPGWTSTARLVQTSVARSFGGFLRTQLVMGLVYGLLAAVVNVAFGLPYGDLTSVASGILHAIPFFGPFVSWLPPVIVALLATSFPVPLMVLAIMAVGWFVTMNVLQPRLMAGAVGIHPIVVLGSVVVGTKVAGVPGAIFGIPIAAVLSAFFFHWFERSREGGSVADRATKRLEEREGHPVRRPQEPVPGLDEDVEEVREPHRASPEAVPGGMRQSAAQQAHRIVPDGGAAPPPRHPVSAPDSAATADPAAGAATGPAQPVEADG